MLKHRKLCLIHGLPLEPEALVSPARAKMTDKGLTIWARDRFDYDKKNKLIKTDICILRFGVNGTYIEASNSPNWVPDIFSMVRDLEIFMMCRECSKSPIFKGKTLGETTLDDLLNIQYYYTFFLKRESNSKYSIIPGVEEIKYHDDNRFYHLGIDLSDKHARGTIGSCERGRKVGDIINSIIKLQIPQFNIEKIQILDQYLDKMKLYCIMS